MFRSTTSHLFILASFSAGSGLAQDLAAMITTMSQSCQAAAGGIASSDFGACSNVMGLMPVLAGTGSILSPLSTWVDSVCSTTPCTSSVVAAALSKTTAGCQADVQKGVTGAIAITTIIQNYQAVHDSLCLSAVSNKTRCAESFLAGVEKSIKRPLNVTDLQTFLVGGLAAFATLLTNAPKDVLCTDCVHALAATMPPPNQISPPATAGNHTDHMANVTSTATASNSTSHDLAPLIATCGDSFGDGKIPSTVTKGSPGSKTTGSGSSPAAGGASNSGTGSTRANILTFAGGLVLVIIPLALL